MGASQAGKMWALVRTGSWRWPLARRTRESLSIPDPLGYDAAGEAVKNGGQVARSVMSRSEASNQRVQANPGRPCTSGPALRMPASALRRQASAPPVVEELQQRESMVFALEIRRRARSLSGIGRGHLCRASRLVEVAGKGELERRIGPLEDPLLGRHCDIRSPSLAAGTR